MVAVATIARHKNKATEPGCLPSSSHSSPPHTLPELAAGPSGWWATQHIICSSENWRDRRIFPEHQVHTEANPSDRGRDTEVRQLRSGSCHYWEENKATSAPASLSKLTPPHPRWLYCQQHLVAGGCTRISWAHNSIAHHISPWVGALK